MDRSGASSSSSYLLEVLVDGSLDRADALPPAWEYGLGISQQSHMDNARLGLDESTH